LCRRLRAGSLRRSHYQSPPPWEALQRLDGDVLIGLPCSPASLIVSPARRKQRSVELLDRAKQHPLPRMAIQGDPNTASVSVAPRECADANGRRPQKQVKAETRRQRRWRSEAQARPKRHLPPLVPCAATSARPKRHLPPLVPYTAASAVTRRRVRCGRRRRGQLSTVDRGHQKWPQATAGFRHGK